MENNKKLLIFAGPNGSGKSTIIYNYANAGLLPGEYICPDSIVKREPFCNIKDEREKYISAMTYAEELRNSFLKDGKSFSVETVFSTENKLDFIKKAKEHGFQVETVFVTTSDPKINIDRIANRVASGGHDVPKDKVFSRYAKTMNLLPEIIKHSDTVKVYDNSKAQPELVFSKDLNGKLLYYNKGWVQEKVVQPLEKDGLKVQKHRISLQNKLNQIKNKNKTQAAHIKTINSKDINRGR